MPTTSVQAGGDEFTGVVLKRGFGGLDEWHEEGLGRFSLVGERLHVDAREGGYTAFYKVRLPDDIAVQYVARTLPPPGPNNINLVSHCQPPAPGWPIVELGRYKGYQQMPNYIVTFVSGINEETGERECPGRQRLRRNPGFRLIAESFEVPSELERDYRITFALAGGRLRYYIDGAKVFDWQDPEPITGGGFFGLRTYKTVEEFSDLTILAL